MDGVAGVVHPDKTHRPAVLPERHRDEPLDPLAAEILPFPGGGLLQGPQVVEHDGLVFVKGPDPASQRLGRDRLQACPLGRHVPGAPLEGVVPIARQPGIVLKEVGPVRLVKLAHRGQHLVDRFAEIRMGGEGLHVAHDFVGKGQALPGALAHILLLGDIQRHLQPDLPAPVGHHLVLEEEMPPAVLILILPDIEGVLAQLGVGAEGAGLVHPVEDLVALAAQVVPHAEHPLPGGVEVVKLVRLQVADVEDVVFRLQDGLGDLVLRAGGQQGPDLSRSRRLVVGLQCPGLPLLAAGGKALRRAGPLKEEALIQRRVQLLQHRQLLRCLHPLAAHPDLAAVRQLQHVAHQTIVIGALLNIPDKAAVDLDLIYLHVLQPAEAGIAGAEIIHGDLDPLGLPSAENAVELGIIHQLPALRQLDGQGAARKAAVPQHPEHIRLNGRLCQLDIGHVHAHPEGGACPPPKGALLQSSAEHPKPHRDDQAALLQQGDELRRRHLPPAGGMVAQQGLRSVALIGLRPHLGLVVKGETGKARYHGGFQIPPQLQGPQPLFVVRR